MGFDNRLLNPQPTYYQSTAPYTGTHHAPGSAAAAAPGSWPDMAAPNAGNDAHFAASATPWGPTAPAPYGTPYPPAQPWGPQTPPPYGAPYQPAQPWESPTPYGAPYAGGMQAAAPIGLGMDPLTAGVHAKLSEIVQVNGLQQFYTPNAIAQLAQSLTQRVNLHELAQKKQIPLEVAICLTSLALYDIVLYADDSGSMAGANWTKLHKIFAQVTDIAASFDSSGLDIRFFNSAKAGDNIASHAQLLDYLEQVSPGGGTPLGTHLDSKVLHNVRHAIHAKALRKPVLVVTFTDGSPTDGEGSVGKAVLGMKQHLAAASLPDKSLAYAFVQIGTDPSATAFLQSLDEDQRFGGNVDCVSDYEVECAQYQKRGVALTPEVYVVKLMVGAIDPTFDEQDE